MTTSAQELSDAKLITAARAGDPEAYGELYRRHLVSANRLARILVRDQSDADDLVAESFARVLAALHDGKGPTEAFRAYLLTTLRHVCYDRTRRDSKIQLTDDIAAHDAGTEFVDPVVTRNEHSYAARAFAKLPERWRSVLWHTEVEQEKPADLTTMFGLSANGVSALALRARRRLREIYLQEHLAGSPEGCHWAAERLGAHVLGGLGARDTAKVKLHLSDCAGCTLRHLELAEISTRMREVLGAIVLGASSAAYLGLKAAVTKVVAAGWWLGVLAWARRLRPRNVAIGGGATAALVAALILALVSSKSPLPPPPPAVVAAPPEVAPPPVVVPPTTPPGPIVPPDPPDRGRPPPPSAARPRPSESAPAPVPAADLVVAPELSGGGLAAGETGELPITVRNPGATAIRAVSRLESLVAPETPGNLSLTVPLPAGFALAAPDAGSGWQCAGTATVTCVHPVLAPGSSSTARVRVAVPEAASGFYALAVTVLDRARRGSAELRVAVAPTGTRIGYATSANANIALAGNTLLSCQPRPLCLSLAEDNQDAVMLPYRAPGAPANAGAAVSGTRLGLPAGATVRWAGLSWAVSGQAAPAQVRLAGPDGGWRQVRADRTDTIDSGHRRLGQAFADVTGLVRSGGAWWLTADGLPTALGSYAGWGLTVVYTAPGEPLRDVAVYAGPDGLVRNEHLGVRTNGHAANVGLLLWDGDSTLTGDDLTLDNAPLVRNVGHSRATGALEGNDWNTFGTDAVRYPVPGTGRQGVLTLSSGEDPLELGVLAVAETR